MVKRIEVSYKTIIFTAVFALALWFLYTVRDIIITLFVSLLIMAILHPLVTRLTKFKIPRGVSIFLVYILVFGILGVAIGMIITPLAEETSNFASGLPEYLRNIRASTFFGQEVANNVLSQIVQIPGRIVQVGASFFSNIVLVIGSLVFAFYLLLARDKFDVQLASFIGDARSKKMCAVIDKLENKLGSWARGQLLLMLIIGIATFVGLFLLGIPYALPLAILAAILEIVPTLGPILAAIPAMIIGFGISPVIGLASAALALLIHQLENYLLVPKIMEKSAGVSPIVILLALAIGARLAGIVGVLISVPVLITVQVLLKEYLSQKSN
jgi:predicted PurR-regulated permease PerM